MSDDLTVAGGGSSAVATDELYANAQQLRELAREIFGMRSQLAGIDGLVSMGGLQQAAAPRSAARAELDLEQARIVLAQIELQARTLEWALGAAAEGYGFAERFIGHILHQLGGDLGELLGRLLPAAALSTTGGLVALGALGGVAGGVIPALGTRTATAAAQPTAQRQAQTQTQTQGGRLLSNPLTVALIRHATQASGHFLAGAAGLPPGLADILGGASVGLGATAVMRGGSVAGALTETPVRLAASRSQPQQSAPTGYAERLARVPDPGASGGAQVVIDKYELPGKPDRFEVYIAGTVTFSPVADTEPWDLTSNIANAAGEGSGSYHSVVEAMRLAGVDENSPVQFTGYSQGAATAARLAASGDYNTQGLLSFGGPTGQISVPGGFPAVLVEHEDDLVTALGGEQSNREALIVRREVFDDQELPQGVAVPAHHIEYYQQTARLMDAAGSQQVTEAIARLDGFGQGASTVTSTAYRFERVSESAAGR